MNTFDCIKTRRSIRKFLNKDINQKQLKKIIEAGMRAPSAHNTEPWHFIILKNETKNKLIEFIEKEYGQNQYKKNQKGSTIIPSIELAKNAPALIMIFNKAPYTKGEINLIKNCTEKKLLSLTVEIQGVAAAIQNMLLEINELGLGAVWLADFNFTRRKIEKKLKCKYDFQGAIALGHPTYRSKPRKIPKIKLDIRN